MSSEPTGHLRHWLRAVRLHQGICVPPWGGRAIYGRLAFLNSHDEVPRDRYWLRSFHFRLRVEPLRLRVGNWDT